MASELNPACFEQLYSASGAAVEPGALHLISTPIGNLSDITLRAARWLCDVDVLYCEDTRVSQKLLAALDLRRRSVSLHEHNEADRIEQILEHLSAERSVGLVSDAGMPVISDPGARLVAAVRKAGYRVTTAPGASAALTALIASGLPATPSTFLGFAPRKRGALAALVQPFAETPGTIMFFESPKRVTALLERLAEMLPGRQLVVARELTKRHEAFHFGSSQSPPEPPARGEMVVMVGPPPPPEAMSSEQLDEAIDALLAEGLRAKAVSKALAGDADPREVYRRCVERMACKA